MKRNFLKTNWMQILIAAIFVGMSIYGMNWFVGMAAVLFAGLLIRNYMKYDADEQESDEWWFKLDKEKKIKLYSGRNRGDTK